MAEYFKIINRSKQEYLEPFNLVGTSERFPNLMYSNSIAHSMGWLTCLSENPRWMEMKNQTDRTRKYVGDWSGDEIVIIGDYGDEELCKDVRDNYVDISIEMMATLCDLSDEYVETLLEEARNDHRFLQELAPIAMVDDPPKRLVFLLCELFPDGWKAEYYKQINS